jgi:predicted MPP superfamily phosphohydrolase
VISVIIVGALVVAGAINARTPRIKKMNLTVSKNSHQLKSLNLVVASDIHLGTIVCRKRLEAIVEKINSLDADIVLLPGDVVDEDIGPVIKQNLGETLRSIKSKFGVFAITGNHEYIGGVEPAVRYLTEHGITILRDETAMIGESFYVIGREDVSFNRGVQRRRKPLSDLLSGIDKALPIIVMDHQPFRLHEAEEQGVDLQLSGHTHHGQLFPFNFITKRIFEVSWGYKQKGKTHIYVSCGVGTWGPPVRIGNTPEIVNINLTFA